MEHTKHSPQSILKIALGIVFGVWLMMCAPTGWIYDLWVGTGTEQGQMPDSSVPVVHTQADVEDSYFQNTPITISKEDLIKAPLLRLRDTEYAGEHASHKNGVRRSVTISEYIPTADLAPVRRFLLDFLGSGFYNCYYLAPLEDGSYVCVYFDDYLMLRPGGELPVGYVRYTTTDERIMLQGMEDSYETDPMYVLDMYRHGKVSWMLDLAIRAGVGLLLLVVGSAIVEKIRQVIRRKAQENMEP